MPIEWDKVHYCDCMDPDIGLPSLPDKSIDLCLTDPPYNIGFKGTKDKIPYDDNMPNYWHWIRRVYSEIKRICERIVFTPGLNNFKKWMPIDDFELIIWYNQAKQGMSKNSRVSKIEPFLTWNVKHPNCFSSNIFQLFPIEREHGFYKSNNYLKTIHPCPKDLVIIQKILEELSPDSVLDPFLGSGTTAKAADILGIKWLGYEINPVYKQDIDKRFAQKQIDLWNY